MRLPEAEPTALPAEPAPPLAEPERPTMDQDTTDTTPAPDAIDDLAWDDDWTPAAVCAIENGPDCEACEG